MSKCLGSKKHSVNVWSGKKISQRDDIVAEEYPIALVFNGISHAVMMGSPNDLESFSIGFSLNEGIVNSIEDIHDIEIKQSDAGLEISLRISNQCFADLKDRRRSLVGRTGCGICGTESLEKLRTPTEPISSEANVSHSAINNAVRQLRKYQPLQEITGSVHGAAWCSKKGEIIELLEDVGRHNALDKLIGTLAIKKMLVEEHLNNGFLLVSSRASYEMVQKASAANISVLVAVSAPTTLAIDMADSLGITLIGFARETRHVCYSHMRRLGSL